MRIAIEATTLLRNQAGVTSYLKGLLEGFNQLPDVEINLMAVGRPSASEFSLERKLMTLYRELVWQPYLLPRKARSVNANLLFSPGHIIATQASLPRFVTFHDFYILRNPQAFTKWHALFCQRQFPKIINSGAHIIVISEFTKKELFHFFPDFKGTVEVIYNGISADWKHIQDKSSLKSLLAKFNLPSEFLFAVGSLEPRKNFATLFDVLDKAPKNKFPPLVLIMPDAWNAGTQSNMIQKLLDEKKLFILKNIDRTELVGLYNLAQCLVYPSLYEGMGAPPMEAMACGCPVVTSRNSALEELYSTSALLVNAVDTEEIADAIEQVLTDSTLRSSLIAKGFNQSSQFTFSKMAQNTLNYFAAYAA